MRKTILFCVLFCSVSAFCQKKWTLQECIAHATAHNISIKQLEIQRQSAEIALNTSQMSRLPDLNASASQNWSFGRGETDSGIFANQKAQSSSSVNMGTSVPLFTGFRITNQIARDKLDLQATVQALHRAQEDLSLNVAMLFLQVVFNRELLIISREQVELSQEQLSKTEVLVQAGKIPAAQLADMQAQLANDNVSLVQAENNLKNALLDLAQSLELEDFTDFDIQIPEMENPHSALATADNIFESALQTKPVIREQNLRIESAEKSLQIARAGHLPTLTLNAGISNSYFYSYNLGTNPITGEQLKNTPFNSQIKDNLGEYVGLSLNIPIFNRFQVRNQVRNSQLNIENQKLTLETTKKTLFKEIQTAFLNASAAEKKFAAAQTAATASSEAFRLASDKYEAGKSTVFELNEARIRWTRSRSEAVQAKYDFIFRTKILDFYAGKKIEL